MLFALGGCGGSSGNAVPLVKTAEKKLPEGIFEFGSLFETDRGELMTTAFAANNGGIVFRSDDFKLVSVPKSVNDMGQVLEFTVYDDRIYFLANDHGSDIFPAFIYSCDMNGGDMKEIANNAYSHSHCFIKDGKIYYDALGIDTYKNLSFNIFETEYYAPRDYDMNTIKGIYKANIDGSDRKCIVPDMLISTQSENELIVSDSEMLETVLSRNKFYSTDLDGSSIKECSFPYRELDMSEHRIITGDGTAYYTNSDGEIFSEMPDGTKNIIKKIPLDKVTQMDVWPYRVSPKKVIYGIFGHENMTNTVTLCSLFENE